MGKFSFLKGTQSLHSDRTVHSRLLDSMTYEIIPLKNALSQISYLPLGSTISVTCSPAKNIEDTLELCENFTEGGHYPIPHLAARMVEDTAHIERIIRRLNTQGIRKVFIIGGDAEQRGPFSDASSFLRVFLDYRPDIDTVGIGGYPDGHPVISDQLLLESLAEKQEMIFAAGLSGYFATQMCFDPGTIHDWLTKRRFSGITLPCHLGIPGHVDITRLISISLRLGVGVSARYLKKNRYSILRLLNPLRYNANRLISPLSGSAEKLGITNVHCFTFNTAEATEAWRQKSIGRLT